jgi:uncharacterized membrane protein
MDIYRNCGIKYEFIAGPSVQCAVRDSAGLGWGGGARRDGVVCTYFRDDGSLWWWCGVLLADSGSRFAAVLDSSMSWLPLTLSATGGWGMWTALGKLASDDTVGYGLSSGIIIVLQKAVEFVYVLQSLFTNKEISAAAFRAAPGKGIVAGLLSGMFNITATVLYSRAIKVGPTGAVSAIGAAYPAVAMVLARFMMGEAIDRNSAIGILFFLAAGVMFALPKPASAAVAN